MLRELWIANLAVMQRLHLSFEGGLNAVTGETGAGKSLVVGGLDLALGARGSADLVRKGAKEAEVTARFEIAGDHFTRQGMDQELEDGALLLRRVIGADGRSRAYVNDRPATVGRLRELGATLADLHGQHEQQNLLRDETHRDYLDAFAGHAELLEAVVSGYAAHEEAARRLREFEEASSRSAEERERLQLQLEELQGAELTGGEEDTLSRERHLATHAERLEEATAQALERLGEGETNVQDLLSQISRLLGTGAELDPQLEVLRGQVDEALVITQDAVHELARYRDHLGSDPARLEEIESRLSLLAQLRRKYKTDESGLIDLTGETQEALLALEDAPGRGRELTKELNRCQADLGEAAGRLSASRSRAQARLARKVSTELRGLGMPGARFSVSFAPTEQGAEVAPGRRVGRHGAEEVRFLLAANPGEPGGVLGRIASGGEASRVMLALKNVLSAADPVPVVLFDEVDAGIGGLVAEAVGSRLVSIAARRQVIVVTHLAVIAGRAGHHLTLRKTTDGKRTRIEVHDLAGGEREEELARMLAGSAGGADARRTARAILTQGDGA